MTDDNNSDDSEQCPRCGLMCSTLLDVGQYSAGFERACPTCARSLQPGSDRETRDEILEIINEVESEVLAEDKFGASRDMIVEGTCERIRERIYSLQSGSDWQTVHIRFDGDHDSGLKFVEVETPEGESIDVGEWDVGSGGSIFKLEVASKSVNTDTDQ